MILKASYFKVKSFKSVVIFGAFKFDLLYWIFTNQMQIKFHMKSWWSFSRHSHLSSTPVPIQQGNSWWAEAVMGSAISREIIQVDGTVAQISSILEPASLSRSDGKRFDGITIVPWRSGRSLVWDGTCPDTISTSNVVQASSEGRCCSFSRA